MKNDCLSEEIFEVVSYEESHYKRRSFDGKARRISQDDKNILFFILYVNFRFINICKMIFYYF